MTGKDKQNQIFKKSKSCKISSTDNTYIHIYIPTLYAYFMPIYTIYIILYIYIYRLCMPICIYIGEDQELIIHVFYWCIVLDLEIYTKC